MTDIHLANNKPVFTPAPELLMLVHGVMEGVMSGAITSLACLTVSPVGQMQWPAQGNQAAELMLAAEMFRDDIKAAMRKPASNILRAR